MITIFQFADYINCFSGERPKEQRLGQWAFNILYEMYPDIANTLRATNCDPFFNDDKIPFFLKELLNFVDMKK